MNLMHESFQSLPVQTLINQISECFHDKSNKLVISSPAHSKIKQLALQYVVWASASTGNFFGGSRVVWILFGRRPQDTPEISFRGKISPEELNSYDLVICDNLTIRSLMWCFYTSRQRRAGSSTVPFFTSEEKNSIRAYAPGPPVFAIGDYTFSQGHSFISTSGLDPSGILSATIERPPSFGRLPLHSSGGQTPPSSSFSFLSGSAPASNNSSSNALLAHSRDSTPSPPISSTTTTLFSGYRTNGPAVPISAATAVPPRDSSSGSASPGSIDDSLYEFVERSFGAAGTSSSSAAAAFTPSIPTPQQQPQVPNSGSGSILHSYPQENYFQRSFHPELVPPEAHPALLAAEREEKLLRCFDLKRELAVHMLRNFEIYGDWSEGQDMKRITLFEK